MYIQQLPVRNGMIVYYKCVLITNNKTEIGNEGCGWLSARDPKYKDRTLS